MKCLRRTSIYAAASICRVTHKPDPYCTSVIFPYTNGIDNDGVLDYLRYFAGTKQLFHVHIFIVALDCRGFGIKESSLL